MVFALIISAFTAPDLQADEDAAIRVLMASGATVERDETRDGKPIRFVSCNLRQVTDDEIEALKELENLPSIQFLGAGDAEISVKTLQALQRKPALKQFSISYAKIGDEAARTLGTLNSLTSLDLKVQIECSPAGLGEILKLKGLRELTLSDRLVNDESLANVGKQSSLQVLNLRSLFISDRGLAELRKLQNLQTLRLFLGKDVTRDGLLQLASVPVKDLEITYFNASDAEIKELRKLNGLKILKLINARKVTGASIPYFSELSELKELDIGGGQLTKEQLEELKQVLPKCKITESRQ